MLPHRNPTIVDPQMSFAFCINDLSDLLSLKSQEEPPIGLVTNCASMAQANVRPPATVSHWHASHFGITSN
jgi:hypothetical protein